jgi:hypothetical protein
LHTHYRLRELQQVSLPFPLNLNKKKFFLAQSFSLLSMQLEKMQHLVV